MGLGERDALGHAPAPALAGVVGLAFFRLDLLFATLIFLVPLSVNLAEFGWTSVGWGTAPPNLLFGLMVLWAIRAIRGQSVKPLFVRHPIALLVAASFVWMGLTIFASAHPVSLEAWIARGWFASCGLFFRGEWLGANEKKETPGRAARRSHVDGVCCHRRFDTQDWALARRRDIG